MPYLTLEVWLCDSEVGLDNKGQTLSSCSAPTLRRNLPSSDLVSPLGIMTSIVVRGSHYRVIPRLPRATEIFHNDLASVRESFRGGIGEKMSFQPS